MILDGDFAFVNEKNYHDCLLLKEICDLDKQK
jgi:hypothetical protein